LIKNTIIAEVRQMVKSKKPCQINPRASC
jgi:hypothetical protein